MSVYTNEAVRQGGHFLDLFLHSLGITQASDHLVPLRFYAVGVFLLGARKSAMEWKALLRRGKRLNYLSSFRYRVTRASGSRPVVKYGYLPVAVGLVFVEGPLVVARVVIT